MIRKPKERQKARQLRRNGKSIKEIAKILSVSPGSVSPWVRDIQLSPTQKQRLVKKSFDALQQGRKKALETQKQIRKRKRDRLIRQAIRDLGCLSQRDVSIAGIALYWGEGFKKDKRLGFANSDPAMIKFFLRWLETVGVPKKEIRLRVGLNISHKKRIKNVEKYWQRQTGIPSVQFQKPFFQKFKWKKEFPNPEEYFGVLRIRANKQGSLFIKILTWIEYLRKNAAGRGPVSRGVS